VGDGEHATPRLAVLKALGDNTRYALYLELARSSRPLTTAEVAETLELHPNTVRPHLERMRDVGLLRVETESRGGVGRPQHRWSLSPDAPSLGFEPPATPLLARLLVGVAAAAGVAPEDAAEIGRAEGRAAMAEVAGVGEEDPDLCRELLVAELDRLGFDPAVAADDATATIAFTHCPYADLAAVAPEIVCSLHRGICEGVVEAVGGAGVSRFGTLVDRVPCSVELVGR
jgi:predicted ArsR family transcriptional regulator